MTSMQVELDPRVIDWVDEIALHVEFLSNDVLLLELALTELQDFYQETYRGNAPKSLRRSLALVKHLAGSFENSSDELNHLIKRSQNSLEASLAGEPLL